MCADSSYIFEIAELRVDVVFKGGSTANGIGLIPSFAPFMLTDSNSEPLLTICVDDSVRPVEKTRRELIRDFDTGNGHTSVERISDGGYQFVIRDIQGRPCCLLITDNRFRHCRCALNGTYNMRSFGLNNALMLAYAFSSSWHGTLLIHASLVRHAGKGYAFVAKSGTGKSTQVSMWLRHLPDCDLMNDDNPIVRVIDGHAFIYGSPWSGKTPCYRRVKAPLGAITKIERAAANSVERLGPTHAFTVLLPACSSMKWDKPVYDNICDTVVKIIATTGIFTLHCLPDKQSAEICAAAITT